MVEQNLGEINLWKMNKNNQEGFFLSILPNGVATISISNLRIKKIFFLVLCSYRKFETNIETKNWKSVSFR